MRGPKPKPKIICSRCNREATPVREFYCKNCATTLVTTGRLRKIQVDNAPRILTGYQEEVLCGLLLGDGCLYRHKITHTPYLIVQRSQTDRQYLVENYDVFKEFCKRGTIDGEVLDHRTGGTTYFSKFVTRRCRVFRKYYEQWYPNGKKIIPKNVEFSPLSLAIFFADDGYARLSSSGELRIQLSTDNFEQGNIEYFRSLIEDKYDINMTTANKRLHTYGKASQVFINVIDSYLPSSMSRKAIWRKGNDEIPKNSTR